MRNEAFWDDRYRTQPWLGSGPGSRGIAQALCTEPHLALAE